MQIINGVFAGQLSNGSLFMPDHDYRIDDYGVQLHTGPHPWPELLLIEAWITTADGNWGFDETWHLRLTYLSGYRFRTTDGSELFSDLGKALVYYLGVQPDWLGGEIKAEYEQRKQRKQRWHGGWFGGRHKPVVYTQRT